MTTPARAPNVPQEEAERAALQAALLRKLVEVLPVGVWLADAHGTIVLGNAAGQRVWAGARYVGIEQFGEYKGWWPDGRRIAAEDWALARAITQGETRIGEEIEIECFDGTRKIIRNSAAPVRDEAGALLGAVVVNEDITALKRELDERAAQERALREANERFERVARATTDAVWDWDLSTDALWWNANFHLLFGYPPEHTLPTIESWSDFIHPADRERVLAEVHAALAGSAGSWSGEYRFRRFDGSYADVFDRGYIERDPAGRAVRMTGAMMDISERKATERALRESEARFRSLSGLSSDWFWETDAEHRFFHTPARTTDLTGYRAPHYVGKRRWEVAGLAPVRGSWEEHQRTLARRESFRDLELVQERGDGNRVYLQVSGEPVHDAEGRFAGYRGTAKDITAQETAEAERQKIARAYASLSAVNELVARARSEAELLQGACEIAVASGEFPFAVVRRVEHDGGVASLAAFAGTGHPERLKRPLDLAPGSPDAASLVVRAYRSGRPAVASGDALARGSLFGAGAEGSGVRAGAAYPLFREGRCVGALLLCSRDAQAFDGQSGILFERMAANVSFGLEALEKDEALRRFRLALDQSADLIGLVDRQTMRYVDANETLCRALGYSREELLSMSPEQVLPFSRAEIEASYDALIAEPARQLQVRSEYLCRDGSRLPFEATRHAVLSQGRWLVVGIGRDIRERLAAEEALRKREAEFRALAENAPDGIMRFDGELRCLYVNAAVLKTAGVEAQAFLGSTLWQFPVPRPLQHVIGDGLRQALATGETQTVEYSFVGPRGERHYQARLTPEKGPDGKAATVLGISRDVTDRKRAERAIAESEARLRSIVYASVEPLLLLDAEGVALFANPAAAALFGRPLDALVGAQLGLPLADGRPAEVEIVQPGGATRPAEMQFAVAQLDGRPVHVVSLHDLSERKAFERHIQHLANHDGLTGLPNRTLLRDRVEQAIAHARRARNHVGLMFVDLDQFKLVNDSWGHTAGDGLLLEVARRLGGAVRDGDTVARLGGDEFVVLLPDLARPGDSALVARKIADALATPVEVLGRTLRVTASIGIGMFPGDGDDLDSLLQCADAAMYRAKDAGRNGYQYYSAEMGSAARARVEVEGGLRLALERGELLLHFQPQARLADGTIQACEALLRWRRPGVGLVSPADFIPVAEESGLIVPIGEWVLRHACREAAAWARAGGHPVKVAVNLSARQFWRGSVTDAVRAALDESGLPASRLEVEITESVVARDLSQVLLTLEQLRRMGVSIAIDDFGTGYSSLSYLRSLPIQKIKVDKSFVDAIPSDRQATALVGEIVRLAHVLSLDVVAEGVETLEQARYLREAGCEAIQGYFFSRPLPQDDCAAVLRSGRRLDLEP